VASAASRLGAEISISRPRPSSLAPRPWHNPRPFRRTGPRPRASQPVGVTMDFLISSAFAQAAAPAAAPNPLTSFLPLIIIFGIFYFMLIRPQMKRAKEARAMVAALAKGDEVLTTGGILGRIDDIADSFVTLE